MKRVVYLCSSAVVVLGLQPSCLLPAVDDRPREKDSGDTTSRQVEATTELDAGSDASIAYEASEEDAGAGDARVSSESDTSLFSQSDAGVREPTDRPQDTAVTRDADAPCGASGAACCSQAPECEGALSCVSGSCGEPLSMRAVYSHRAPGADVDALDYVAFSATRRGEARHLLTRASIRSIIGSRDGNRLAFLASASTAEDAPTVVWLVDGVDEGAEPTMIASSNLAQKHTVLMADANLDYLLSCTGTEFCGELELYRRNEQTFTTIASNVWSAIVGYDNGLLVYQTEDRPLQIYWLDLSEVDAVPKLLMTAADEDHIPFIGPAMLAQAGRTLTYIEAVVSDETTVEDMQWTVFGTKLGQSDPVALQSGVGLISVYTQRDGSSALVVPTDIQGRHTTVSRYPTTGSGFGAEQELFNKELEQKINPDYSVNDIALSPLLDTYDSHFYFFGAPQSIVDGNVFLTPQTLELDGGGPLTMTEEACRVYTSGQDMLSPRIELSEQFTAAALGWMRCNQKVGHINLNEAHSFTAIDETCAECSPGKYFEPIGEGIVYSHVDSSAISTPYYYATTKTSPLELIPSGAQSGKVQSLFVARSEDRLSPWREAWHLGGAFGLSLPRSWRKRSTTVEDQSVIVAGPTVHLGNDPMVAGGVRVSATTDTTLSPEQILAALGERNQCATLLGSDAGSVTREGVSYEFYSELRMNCGGTAQRWFVVLRASDHSVVLALHDAQGSGQSDFEQMSASIRVETSRLSPLAAAGDAGATEQ